MIETHFKTTLSSITNDTALTERFWQEVTTEYNKPDRHYHNLTHLNHLVNELATIKDNINDWPVLVFSVAFHDIVYNVLQKDNEEKSADIAVERLSLLQPDNEAIEKCREQILATKNHAISKCSDTNYFTDADLSILGQDYDTYKKYTRQIRKEYRIYPDFLYRPGRRKVLKHFLEMPAIFKTNYFSEKYEQQARENMLKELKELG